MAESKKNKQEEPIIEEIEELDEFDITALLIDPQAVIERKIKYFNQKTQKPAAMKVYLRPISHANWNDITQKVTKNPSFNVEERIAALGWCDDKGIELDLSQIKQAQKGVVSAVYEELKFISGYFEDRMEEKFLEKVANPS